jgi:TRAP-type C4-dicarboxylate transport system substrate-binding protein
VTCRCHQVLIFAVCLIGGQGEKLAGAEPAHVLRFATSAPEGTAWSRELNAFAREIATASNGTVIIKWVFGGIAGDEVQAAERMARGQLDGIGSAGMLCERRAPSFRVLHLVGLYRGRDEVEYVAARLRGTFAEEFHREGLLLLGEAQLGPTDLFARRPLTTFDELKRASLWVWNADQTQAAVLREMGFQIVSLPLEDAGAAYDQGRHDGFFSIPSATLAFQWSHRTKYLLDLRISYLVSCLMVSERAFDSLTTEQKQIVHAAAGKLHVRLSDVVRHQDDSLLGGLFQRQGLTMVPTNRALSETFFEQAARARAQLGERLIPAALMRRTEELLAEARRAKRASSSTGSSPRR